MDWNNPEALYWILPLCLAWLVLAIYSNRRKQRAREAFVSQAMWTRILPEETRIRFWLKQILRVTAIVASLVALAGPRFGTEIEQIIPRGSDLYVLIDVSRSMLAEDVTPSRLGRAKADVSALVNRLEGERIGLIAFAGQAVVKCPLTIDYDSFRRALKELDPSSAPRGGTAIGDAIRKGLDVFQGKMERDQAMLIITDGDDQQSYPLEAAATASEHNVTVFTVGLGDSEQGARIPQKEDANNFVEYKGEQVWSKLDGSLLEQIALKTKGVYVPAGTRAYDLGELYSSHLQGRRAEDAATQERTSRSQQYQIFLAIAVIALLIDLCISPFRQVVRETLSKSRSDQLRSKQKSVTKATVAVGLSLMLVFLCFNRSDALEPHVMVREGLQLYSQEKYDVAREKFAAALEELDKNKSEYAAVAAFDEACALHRKGEIEKARENYLRAGISKDRSISVPAHFNLGALSADQARTKAGEKPETVAADQRQEVIDHLMRATAAYRHCLELQPDHQQARNNLELVRLWIKYYSDKWREIDRQKRRDESNLIVFLQYIIDTQLALKEAVQNVPSNLNADGYAELKQSQSELADELPTLKAKIDKDLRPPTQSGTNSGPTPTEEESKQLEEGIRMLQGWADAASEQMSFSSRALGLRKATDAIGPQQAAIDELDKIWDAVIPFHPLLAKELADQTAIAKTLNPNGVEPKQTKEEPKEEPKEQPKDVPKVDADTDAKNASKAESPDSVPDTEKPKLEIADDDLKELSEKQERTLRKSRLLAPKAQQELEQLERQPEPDPASLPSQPNDPNQAEQPTEVDPEEVKAGYRKAIELAPQAVEQMESALQFLKQKDPSKAAESAEEARRILKEIQDAQPKNKQDQQDKQEQNKNDEQKKDEEKKDSEDKKDEQKKDQQKPEEKKPEDDKSDPKKDQDKQSEKEQPKVSPDRIEEALRKVRERQEDKRDRDRELKAKILGRLPVDKDW